MPDPVFPHADLQDSSLFRVSLEDPVIRSDPKDGKEFTRARHTRTPRKTFSSGMTFVPNAIKLDMEAFWDTVVGGSLVFEWENPADSVTYLVRFTKPISFKYVGLGENRRWNIEFEVRQA